MDEALGRWMARLPWRWALGGFVLGTVWVVLSVGLTTGVSSPSGGLDMAFIRVGSWFVIPPAMLGAVWGLSERRRLRAARQAGTLDVEARHFLPRQIGKAMVCGLAFGILLDTAGTLGPHRAGSDDPAVITLLGLVLGAVPIGLAVGLVSGRALKRRLAQGRERTAVF